MFDTDFIHSILLQGCRYIISMKCIYVPTFRDVQEAGATHGRALQLKGGLGYYKRKTLERSFCHSQKRNLGNTCEEAEEGKEGKL